MADSTVRIVYGAAVSAESLICGAHAWHESSNALSALRVLSNRTVESHPIARLPAELITLIERATIKAGIRAARKQLGYLIGARGTISTHSVRLWCLRLLTRQYFRALHAFNLTLVVQHPSSHDENEMEHRIDCRDCSATPPSALEQLAKHLFFVAIRLEATTERQHESQRVALRGVDHDHGPSIGVEPRGAARLGTPQLSAADKLQYRRAVDLLRLKQPREQIPRLPLTGGIPAPPRTSNAAQSALTAQRATPWSSPRWSPTSRRSTYCTTCVSPGARR